MFSISISGNKVNLVNVSVQLFSDFRKVFFLYFFLTLFVLLSALGRLQFSICFYAGNLVFIFQPHFPDFFFFFNPSHNLRPTVLLQKLLFRTQTLPLLCLWSLAPFSQLPNSSQLSYPLLPPGLFGHLVFGLLPSCQDPL